MRYLYQGDRLTAPHLRGLVCDPVRDARGKCIVGAKGSALITDAAGNRYVVNRRCLRLLSKLQPRKDNTNG